MSRRCFSFLSMWLLGAGSSCGNMAARPPVPANPTNQDCFYKGERIQPQSEKYAWQAECLRAYFRSCGANCEGFGYAETVFTQVGDLASIQQLRDLELASPDVQLDRYRRQPLLEKSLAYWRNAGNVLAVEHFSDLLARDALESGDCWKAAEYAVAPELKAASTRCREQAKKKARSEVFANWERKRSCAYPLIVAYAQARKEEETPFDDVVRDVFNVCNTSDDSHVMAIDTWAAKLSEDQRRRVEVALAPARRREVERACLGGNFAKAEKLSAKQMEPYDGAECHRQRLVAVAASGCRFDSDAQRTFCKTVAEVNSTMVKLCEEAIEQLDEAGVCKVAKSLQAQRLDTLAFELKAKDEAIKRGHPSFGPPEWQAARQLKLQALDVAVDALLASSKGKHCRAKPTRK